VGAGGPNRGHKPPVLAERGLCVAACPYIYVCWPACTVVGPPPPGIATRAWGVLPQLLARVTA